MNKKDFSFTGSGDEYFKIWIVNVLLTILTLGIYSAWATVRQKRYFYGNTVLDENNFEYHGKPMQILIGRIFAVALLIIYVFISQLHPIAGMGFIFIITLLMPFFIMRSMKFNARMSSYRNVRFSFHGNLWDAYSSYLLIPLLPLVFGAIVAALFHFVLNIQSEEAMVAIGGITMLAIFALVPFVETLALRYQFNNLQYGQGQFFTKIQAKPIYMFYLKLIGVVILCYAALGAIIGGGALLFNANGSDEPSGLLIGLIIVFIIPLYIAFFLSGIFAKAYLQSHKRNYLFSQTGLDNVLILGSSLKPWPLFKILATNLLLIVLTAGFAKPWVLVRTHRHILDHTNAKINGDLSQYVSKQQGMTSSFGDEMGDAFDLEGGFEVGI